MATAKENAEALEAANERIRDLEGRLATAELMAGKVQEMDARVDSLVASATRMIEPPARRHAKAEEIANRHRKARREGRHRWFMHDRRKDQGWLPVEFWSDRSDAPGAMRDYEARTGMRYTGSGATPFYVSASETPAN